MIWSFHRLGASFREVAPGPTQMYVHVLVGIRVEREFGAAREKIVAQNPVRSDDESFAQIGYVVVLENAANLNVWKSEYFGHVLYAARLHDHLVERSAAEFHDGSVWPDGSGVKI